MQTLDNIANAVSKRDAFRKKKDILFLSIVVTFSIITILPIILIIKELVVKGYRQINWSFFTETTPDSFQAMTAVNTGTIIPGGILNGITGTLFMVVLAALIAIPVGILIGLYLYENPNKWYANIVRDVSDIIQGIPSIVIGLIGYLWIVKHITNGYSALAGSVTMAIMMLPLIIRATEETMKMIPISVREAAFALGVPYHKVITKVMLPSGLSGLMTGVLLAISRVLGETAPLMITALGSAVVNFNVEKPTSAVPLLIWEFYNDPNMVQMVWSSSLFLMGLVLVFNLLSKSISAKRNK